MRCAVPLVAITACAYQPGSFRGLAASFPGQRTTIGCLDVTVDERHERDGVAELEYNFGNRCDHPTVVDLAAVRVFGRTGDGRELAMAAIDRRHELRALPIDGRLAGREAIAYDAGPGELAAVCVDVAPIAHATPAQWLCFGDARLAVTP